MSVVAMVG